MKHLKFMIIFVLAIATIFPSCEPEPEPDPVIGCTNENAENYNPLAEESDQSCIFARDKFIGEYNGTIDCDILIMDPTDFRMIVTEGLTGDNNIEIEFKDTQVALPVLSGYAKGDSIIVDPQVFDIALNPDVPDITTPVTLSAVAIANESDNSIAGTLWANAIVFGTEVNDVCIFSGAK